MRTQTRLAGIASALAIVIAGLSPVTASHAAGFVSSISWANLHVKKQAGVFERYTREFNDKEQLIILK